MAEAIIAGLSRTCQPDTALWVSDIDASRRQLLEQRYGVRTFTNNRELAAAADILVLAVKPQVVETVMQEIGSVLHPRQTLISIAAGVTLATIERYLTTTVGVVRVMPNTPALVGAGAAAFCLGTHAGEVDRARTQAIFQAVGRVVEVREDQLNAVTGLSGSGPAYVFLFIEALADAGVLAGLNRDTALVLAAQTVMGAARMVLETGEHPAALKDKVTTPGGTTIAGLKKLEEAALRAAVMRAVEAATFRAQQLAEQKNSIEV